jgi:hypothetical protein
MRLKDVPIQDYDPETGEVPTEASRARIQEGLKQLTDSFQRPLDAAREAEDRRLLDQMRDLNRQLADRDGFTTPEGCSIPVSPTLIKILQPSRHRQV